MLKRAHKSPVVAVWDSGYEDEFSSITEAAQAYGVAHPRTISDCCRGLADTSGGVAWRYKDKPANVVGGRAKKGKAMPVIGTHIDSGFEEYYASMSLASEAHGVSVSRLSLCVVGKAKSAKGMTWRVAVDDDGGNSNLKQ